MWLKRVSSVCSAVIGAAFLAACAVQTGTPAPATQARLAPQSLPPAPVPESLTGVGPEKVRAVLGSPAFRRTEPGAEIWQYGAPGCRLFVYFYEEANGLASAHLDARQSAGGSADLTACLSEVVQAAPTGAIVR